MKIIGVENMSASQVNTEIQAGARFVIFQYCISVIVVSFKRGSNIYFVRKGESTFGRSLPFTALSLVLGWWGIPWGPIWTIATVVANLRGGRDVTNDVVRALSPQPAPPASVGR